MQIIHKAETGSTNDDAIALAREGASDFTTVVADYQDSGRGRQGNSWSSPPGKNLLFSTVLRPDICETAWHRIPQIAGMEMIHAVENHFRYREDLKMKWPNDLYDKNRKWAGILVESHLQTQAFTVLGIGVNCFGGSDEYPDELRDGVTTLEQIFGVASFDRMKLLEDFLTRLEASLNQFLNDFEPVVSFANRRDYLVGKKVTVNDGGHSWKGIASGIGENGELLMTQDDGQLKKIVAGSVFVHNP